MVVGLGSGSTAALWSVAWASGSKQEGLKITAVSTSDETTRLATQPRNIPSRSWTTSSALDINLDGADEIDGQFRMIKGRGGALLREKIVAYASQSSGDDDHRAKNASNASAPPCPVPVEVSSIGVKHTERRLRELRLLDRDPSVSRRLALPDRRRQSNRRLPLCLRSTTPNPSTASSNASPACSRPGFFIGLCDTLIVRHGATASSRDARVDRSAIASIDRRFASRCKPTQSPAAT